MIKKVNSFISLKKNRDINKNSSKHKKKRILLNTVLGLVFGFSTITQANNLNIYETNYQNKYSSYILQQDTDISVITFRFIEGIGVQLENGRLTFDSRSNLPVGITQNDILTSINIIDSLLNFESLELYSTFNVCLQKSILSADTREDMSLYESINLPPGSKFMDYEKLLANLNQLKIVKIAYSEPIVRPSSILPITHKGITPDLEIHQNYLGAPPNGINALFAWSLNNGAGENINIIDIEYSWRLNHEDMPALFYNSGHFYDPGANPYLEQVFEGHGTAVLGILGAKNNGFGITGIAHNANIGVQSEFGLSRATAVCDALDNLNAGDVLLLEQQTPGPIGEYLPVEWEPAMFTAILHATQDENVVVVEAAGNGLNSRIGQDLDSSRYEDINGNNLFNLNFRDSGAIIVGASHSDSRTRMEFSNYGSRVTVNGWGENVTTLGRDMTGSSTSPQFSYLWGENQTEDFWYRSTFNGTSSASPIVAGSVAIIQSVSDSIGLSKLDSIDMRTLLASTGTPQASGSIGFIGSQPNLEAAISSLVTPDLEPTINIVSPFNGEVISPTGSFVLTANATDDNGVVNVHWKVTRNGQTLLSVNGNGVNFAFTTDVFAIQGQYVITATATDTIGQTSVDVNVLTVEDLFPLISILNPSDGSTIARTNAFTLSAQASDDVGVVGVNWQILKNGVVISSAPGNGANYSLVTSEFNSAGSYVILASVEDTHGQITTDTHMVEVKNKVLIALNIKNETLGETPIVTVSAINNGPDVAHNVVFEFTVKSQTGNAEISNLPNECVLTYSTDSLATGLGTGLGTSGIFGRKYRCSVPTMAVNKPFEIKWDSLCPGRYSKGASLDFSADFLSVDEIDLNIDDTVVGYSYWYPTCTSL
jgi:hypothetical protein